MTRKNKRGNIVTFIVSIATISALILAFVLIASRNHAPINSAGKIGVKQSAILNSYATAQEVQLYFDIASPYVMNYALAKLANNGGQIRGEDGTYRCGNYVYPLWNTKDKACIPDVETSLAHYVNKEFTPYFQSHPFLNGYDEPFTSIEYSLSGKKGIRVPLLLFQQEYVVAAESSYPLQFHIGTKTFGAGQPSNACPQDADLLGLLLPAAQCDASDCRLYKDAATLLIYTEEVFRREGYTLIVTSAHRSLAQQQALWDACLAENSVDVCRTKVAEPSCASPHVTGKAVDIKVLELDAGTGGWRSMEGATPEQQTARNRVQELMCSLGWVRFHREWWHFEYGTDRWRKGKDAGLCAI